jgi:hypothetical protein
MRTTSYIGARKVQTRHTTIAYHAEMADDRGSPSPSLPTIPGLAEMVDEAHGRAPGRTLRLPNARVVEQLHRLRTASAETALEAEAIRRRAASRERSALLRAAAEAGLSEEDAQRHLVAAGAAARRLGITRERLRQLADAEAIECFKTSLGRVYRSEDLDRLSAAGWSRRQPVPKHCSSIDCSAIALDAWEYVVVPGVEIQISMCASHIAAVVTRRR